MERAINLNKGSAITIGRHSNIFHRYFFLLFGSLFLCLFFFDVLLGEWNFFFVGYLLIGLGYISLHFYYKKKYGTNSSYISWDDDKILIRTELPQPPSIYSWTEVDSIRVSKNYLSIKSGAANGLIIDLNGYKKEDIERLKSVTDQFSKIKNDANNL